MLGCIDLYLRRSAADATKLQTAVASWLRLNWPQQGAALVAGRAAALRCVLILQQLDQPSGTETLLPMGLQECQRVDDDGEGEAAADGSSNGLGGSQQQAAAAADSEDDPPFVGITKQAGGHPWKAQIQLGERHQFLGAFSSREEAAAAYDVAPRWKLLHTAGATEPLQCKFRMVQASTVSHQCDVAGHQSAPFNFPQLRECEELRATLQGGQDVAALKDTIAEWMRVQWQQRGVALVAGRAKALGR